MWRWGDAARRNGFEPELWLFGPDGTLLDYDWGYDGIAVSATATRTGAHYLVAGDYGGNGGGTFYLSLGVMTVRPGTSGFAGTVRARTNNVALPGALVTAWSGSALRGLTWADNAGAYALPGLAAGTYELRASHPDFSTQIVAPVSVLANQTLTVNFILDLPPPPPPRLVAPGQFNGLFRLRLEGQPNTAYRLRASRTLAPAVWATNVITTTVTGVVERSRFLRFARPVLSSRLALT